MRRDRLALVGGDPAVDGIHAAGNGDPRESALLIRDARNVRVANIQLMHAAWDGLRILNSHDEITTANLMVQHNGRGGVAIIGSSATMEDVVVTGNGRAAGSSPRGLSVSGGGNLSCLRCTVEAASASGAGAAAYAIGGSSMSFEDSDLTGGNGVAAFTGSRFDVVDSTISATSYAALSVHSSNGRVVGTNVSGSLGAAQHAELRLGGVTQTGSSGAFALAEENASLVLERDASAHPTSVGDVFLSGFSNARISQGASLGVLVCSEVSDAYCDGSETKTGSSCAACP